MVNTSVDGVTGRASSHKRLPPLPGLLGTLVLCTRLVDTCGLSMAALDASCQIDVCMLACRQSLFPALTYACSCVCLHRIHTMAKTGSSCFSENDFDGKIKIGI